MTRIFFIKIYVTVIITLLSYVIDIIYTIVTIASVKIMNRVPFVKNLAGTNDHEYTVLSEKTRLRS